jgi:hypothetical protein
MPVETRPTATPAPLCGGPPTMLVLGIGADNRDNNYLYGLADAIRVARIDFTVPAVSMLTFRDLWVEIPNLTVRIEYGKLNQAYLTEIGMGYYEGPGRADLLAHARPELWPRPDHCAVMRPSSAWSTLSYRHYLDQPSTAGRSTNGGHGLFPAGQHL